MNHEQHKNYSHGYVIHCVLIWKLNISFTHTTWHIGQTFFTVSVKQLCRIGLGIIWNHTEIKQNAVSYYMDEIGIRGCSWMLCQYNMKTKCYVVFKPVLTSSQYNIHSWGTHRSPLARSLYMLMIVIKPGQALAYSLATMARGCDECLPWGAHHIEHYEAEITSYIFVQWRLLVKSY